MDAATIQLITQIITWGSLGLLILIVLIILFAGIIGWRRGIFNAGFRLLFVGILIIIALSTVRPMVDFIGSRDMGPLLRMFGYDSPTISIGGSSISFQITSIYDTLTNLLIALGGSYGVVIPAGEIAEIVHGLVYLILSTFVVVMDGILISSLGNLGATILYHAIFKHLISKRVRKVVRVRGMAMLMGSVKSILVGAMLIFPFSSLINNAVQAFKDEDNGIIIDNELLSNVTTIVDAYDNSVLANVLFNWTAGSDGKTWDVMLMDSLTSADINGIKVSFIDELYNIVGIGKTLTSAGIFSEGGMDSIGSTLLANNEMVVSLLSAVGNSGLVLILIPIAVEIARNLDVVQNFVDTSLLGDLSDIDWKHEINNIGKMYQAVYDTGLLDDIVSEGGDFVFDASLITKLFDEETYSGIMNIFRSIDESLLLSRAIPAIAYTMAQNNPAVQQFSDFLPTEWNEYAAIKWGAELGIIYDAMFRLNAIDASLLPALMESTGEDNGGEEEPTSDPRFDLAIERAALGAPYMSEDDVRTNLLDEEPEEPEEPAVNPMEIILRHAGAIKQILVGDMDANGNPIGVDANGVTRVFDNDGNRLYNRHYALFDSQLLQYSLSGAITALINLLSETIDLGDLDLQPLFDELDEGVPLLNYKKEYGAVLNLLVMLGENDATRAFALDLEALPGITFNDDGGLESIDPNLVNGLKAALPQIDKSRLLSMILPKLMESVFAGEQMAGIFDTIGIDAATLNWDTPRLGREFAMLIDAFDNVQELMSIMAPYQGESGDISPDDFGDLMFELSENTEPLAKMLDTLYASNIINEKYQANVYDEFNNLVHAKGDLVNGTDSNFYLMLDFVFDSLLGGRGFSNKKDVYNVAKWTNSRTLSGDFRRDKNGNAIYDGETGFITGFIAAIGRTRLLDIVDVGAGESIDYGELGAAVSEVFAAVEKSAVFSATFGDVLDMYILDAITDDPGDVTFNNVTDWAAEGEAFERLCLAIEDFGDLDFANFDFIGSNPDNVVELLSALADSQMFDGPDGYLFGDFFYDQLTTSLAGNLSYFYDPNATTTNELQSDFDSLETRPAWQDEITLFGDALRALQNANVDINGDPIDTSDPIDYLGLLTTGKVTSVNVGNILTALNNTTTMRMIIYNGYNQIATAFQSDDINLSTMNNLALVDMTRVQRQGEIDRTVKMYQVIEHLGAQDPITGDYSYEINFRNVDDTAITDLRSALNDLVTSIVFNSLDSDSLPGDKTVFKQFMSTFMSANVVKEAIYRPENPKDIDGVGDGLYSDGTSKIVYLLDHNFPTPTVNPSFELVFDMSKTSLIQQGYVDEMVDLLDVMISLDAGGNDPYSVDGFDIEYEMLNEANFESILNVLNDAELLYDCVPNMISRIVHDESAFAIDDVNLAAANPFFHYAGTNYTNRFPSGEISELSDLFVLIQEFATLVPSGDIDMSLLTTGTNLSTFKDTLVALQETETFYLAGSSIPGELSVFEQIMHKIYLDANLARLSYNQVRDYNPSVTSINQGIEAKLTAAIIDFPNFADPLHGASLNAGSWSSEIEAIGDLITEFNSLGLSSGDFASFTADSIEPSQLSSILQSINKLDVVKDAIPYMIEDALFNPSINFNRYSTYEKANFAFDAGDFAGALGTITLSDGTYNIDIAGSDVTSDGSTISVSSGGYIYNVDPISDISTLVIDAESASDFIVYYGNTANPTTNSYILSAAAGNVYTIDLTYVPYQYFRIEAVTTLEIEDVAIRQAIEVGDYMQSQVSYRDTNIPILIDLMDEFYNTGTDSYYDFNQPDGVVGFVNDGNSTAPILAFITESDFYQTDITPNYKAESIFLYNILSFEMNVTIGGSPLDIASALAHNVRGVTTDNKLAKLDDILNSDSLGKFAVDKEGDAIDYGLFAMAFIEGSLAMPTAKAAFISTQDFYLYNITHYDTGSGYLNYLDLAVGSSTRGVIDTDFMDDYGHSLLISEIVAGQLNEILINKYDYLDDHAIPYTPLDLYDGEYALLNTTERLGLSGAVKALYYSFNSLAVPNSEMSASDITAAFESMLDSDMAMIFYQADIYPCLTGSILDGGRNLIVDANPTTLSDWQDIANALIASRGL